MMRLTTILIILGSVKAYGQNYPAYVPNNLIDKQINWSPSIKMTPRLAEFESWTKGASIDIGYQQFFGVGNPSGDGHGITGMYYNCRQWATQLKAAGVQYCILTVNTAYGFSAFSQKTMWPVPPALYTGTGNFATVFPSGVILPRWQKDDLEQAGNANFLYQFCYEMRRQGIEPIMYIPIHDDGNRGGSISLVVGDYPTALRNAFVNYMCKYIQELIIRFRIRYIWLDGAHYVYPGYMQKIYNAVKSVTGQNNANECLVITNTFPGTEAEAWPFDIRTLEYFIYGNQTSVFKNSMLINGIRYYIPTELVNTAHNHNTAYYSMKRGQSGYEDLINQSSDSLQAQFNITKQYHARYCLFLLPDYLGNIPTQQLTLLKNLN